MASLICLNLQLAELETKRILLEIFKERQRKSAEAGSIPSFYKKVKQIGLFSLDIGVLFLIYAMIKVAIYLKYVIVLVACIRDNK